MLPAIFLFNLATWLYLWFFIAYNCVDYVANVLYEIELFLYKYSIKSNK